MKVAALQMTSGPDVGANLAAARLLLEQARAGGARVAVLPENFSFMGMKSGDKREIAEADGDGPVQQFLSQQARELSLWIIGGTTPLRIERGGRVAAACLVYSDDGRRAARYDKMHLFDVDIPGRTESYRESADIAAGRRPILVPTPAGLLGLSVCYDMRFPELYRQLAAAGAQWLSIPSSFTVPTGQAHWEVLLRARAIENLCYVVAPAQWGHHANGRQTYGDSLIVDYWGVVTARLASGNGVVVAELDLAAQAAARRNFPALTHRVL
ncbi:MAG TPA: carbon-nitrogen hydrolase family protein [Steroidobacteraceae bacterium]|jgi:predicted amidohydrolase|nr:carbon-nitrogen hydrolase family protein [Steroidobacteraceae bacterium]